MSTLPLISGSIMKEDEQKGEEKMKSASFLPKLEVPKNSSQPQNKPKLSPRASPRLKPIKLNNPSEKQNNDKDNDDQNINKKNFRIQSSLTNSPKLSSIAHLAPQVPMLGNRRVSTKSGAEIADELAQQAWDQRHRFVAFVPRKVLPEMPEMRVAAERCTSLQGVVSFLDVAGFTKLTERLALQADGAERLADIINKLMGQLVGTLKSGDVIK